MIVRAALALGLCIAALVCNCSPDDQTAERKALADANAKLNQYCDARAKALTVLQSQDASVPVDAR